jgi:dTDP-glucose 4,6-dehydratase
VKLLVTGGAGFIGSNFVRYWVDAHPGDRVVVYDALTYAGNRANLEGLEDRVPFLHADICDLDQAGRALHQHQIDVVVNFAAESHNSLAVLDPGRFFRTNVLGTQTLLEASRHAGVARFHHISTCEVYGDLDLDPDSETGQAFTESSPYRPRTPYNASKAGADHAVRAYHETYGLPVTITNCANNYGPYQFPEKVIPLFVTNLLDGGKVPLYGDGLNVRDWLHVDDHCRGIQLVADGGRAGEIYNIGGGTELTNRELTERLLSALGVGWDRVEPVTDRKGHDRRYSVDITKISAELGYQPRVSFDAGLAGTVRWYSENRAWWEPLKNRAALAGK